MIFHPTGYAHRPPQILAGIASLQTGAAITLGHEALENLSVEINSHLPLRLNAGDLWSDACHMRFHWAWP